MKSVSFNQLPATLGQWGKGTVPVDDLRRIDEFARSVAANVDHLAHSTTTFGSDVETARQQQRDLKAIASLAGPTFEAAPSERTMKTPNFLGFNFIKWQTTHQVWSQAEQLQAANPLAALGKAADALTPYLDKMDQPGFERFTPRELKGLQRVLDQIQAAPHALYSMGAQVNETGLTAVPAGTSNDWHYNCFNLW